MSFSECDPLQFQAATELGSLSQKRRPVLADLTNAGRDHEINTPIRPKCATNKKGINSNTRQPTTPCHARTPSLELDDGEAWLSLKYPPKLAMMRSMQEQNHHIFEIENRRLSHMGAMPTPKRPTGNAPAKPTKFTFRFMNTI